ncbi:sulfite exporter TauE/SafE family protein [Sphingobacteriales bacterium UPWRP_1]|nr:hypothetical protein B6N25_17140 [Sphingobacteriales bacterium TSM_CSS]PSJ73257.1 sulfite exporter TauE/SafE family protein [Sphingobacteriales bacterium UPWRP_1]
MIAIPADAAQLLFYLLLALTAFLYASVGHGGASGYLALMALFSLPQQVMKPTALLLNILVSGIAFLQYYRQNGFNTRLFLPLAAASVPAAFAGGLLTLHGALYRQVLGALLVFPAVKLMGWGGTPNPKTKHAPRWQLLLLGAVIGWLSGLIGIGGGVLLSPVLLLSGWANAKTTAGISALFILVNSVSAFGGQWVQGVAVTPQMAALVAAALPGGLAGAYVGANHYSSGMLKKVLAVVLIIASVKLIFS